MKIKIILWTVMLLCVFPINALKAETPPGHIIGVFGDSLGDGVWSGLYNTAQKHPADKLFRHAKVGAGLTRPDFVTWMHDFSAELESDKIDTAMVMFGANDEQGIRDQNHKGYVFKSEGWNRTYTARIDQIFAEFEKHKVTVIWIGLPVMRSKEMNDGAAYLNNIFSEEVKAHNGIFVPLAEDFKGADGAFSLHFTDPAGKSHLLRAEDGVHFTGYGYEVIALKAYAAIPAITPQPAVPPAEVDAPKVQAVPTTDPVPEPAPPTPLPSSTPVVP